MKRTVCIIVALLLTLPCSMAGAGVTARVSSTMVRVGVPFHLTLDIAGKELGDPVIPDASGLSISGPVGTERKSSYEFVNGRMSSKRVLILTYSVVADGIGKRTIPPITVEVDGKKERTRAIVLTVTDAPEPIQTQRGTNRSSRNQRGSRDSSRGGGTPQPTWDEAGFAEIEVSKRVVVQGEPIYLTLRTGVIQGYGIGAEMGLPTTEGFYAVPEQPKSAGKRRMRRGKWNYDIEEFKQVLFPTATGDLTIGPWEGTIGKRSFFGMDSAHSLVAPAVAMTIAELPPAPAGFTGAVGRFDVEGTVSKDEVLQGVPIDLVITVRGEGNPDVLAPPKLPKVAGTYVMEPETTLRVSSEVGSALLEKTFTYSVTPLEPGDLEMPLIDFVYFDPEASEYVTRSCGPFAIRVLPSVESNRHVVFPEDVDLKSGTVDVLAEDIMPIILDVDGVRPGAESTLVLPLAYGTPVAAYAGLAVFMRRRRRFDGDKGWARSQRAKSRFHKRLDALAESGQAPDELYKALTGFLADKLDIAEGGLTSAEVKNHLDDLGVEGELTRSMVKILKACERASYGSSALEPAEVQALVQGAQAHIGQLEEELKQGLVLRGARRKGP